jgi:murein DD-endopeptidase MepM/ murein hydrolase activator NlpD
MFKRMMNYRRLISYVCVAALMIGLCGSVLPAKVNALSSDEIQEQIDALEEQNEQIQAQIEELEQQKQDNYSEMEEVVREKSNIDEQIALLNAQIMVTEEQVSAYAVLISDKQAEFDEAQAHFEELNEKNRERIRAMEENGAVSYWSVLFKANSFSDFLDRLNMIQEIAAADKRRLEEMNQAALELSQAREELVVQKEALEQTKLGLSEAKVVLDEKRQQSNSLLADLVARGEEYQLLLDEGEALLEEKLQELAEKEVEYTEALQREWEAAHPPTLPESSGGSVDAPVSDGDWVVPCSYVYVSSPFNPNRVHPILGYARPHNGIDLAANLGNPVYATRSGSVTVADYEGDGAGNYVFINHGDGFSSVYMHMDYYIVGVGEYVSAGEVIGYVGTTGLSEGPHLHFGIAYNGSYVNPASYINF